MDRQSIIRLSVFASVFLILGVLEMIIPDRDAKHTRRQRWPGNLAIIAIGNVLVRILGPLLPYAVAESMMARSWGLTAVSFVPAWMAVAFTVLVLDAWIYLQHVLFHQVPFLRPFHRMHHSDTHIDFTTGFRMHPVEILISAAYKSIFIAALGLHPLGVLIFEVILNASSMYTHANIRLGTATDRVLRKLLITPDVHRLHHSRRIEERNSNYGFFLSIWDRLFSTYTSVEDVDPRGIEVGLPGYDDPQVNRVDKLIVEPFASYPLTKRKSRHD
jgi:sterol desaturase/sphingolipid hydroxylase (fatty acid hydroxylase superfamily)